MSTEPGATSPIGRVGFLTPQIVADPYVRPSDVTQYSLGDIIGNSLTGASVTPITFPLCARFLNGSGRVTGARCTLTAASGTIVLPAFDLLLFRPVTNIPVAAGSYPADNAALDVSAAAFAQLIGVFTFAVDAWRNQAGGVVAAGDHVWQAAKVAGSRAYAPFSVNLLESRSLIGVMQAQNTWNPGAVVNTFDFALEVEQD